MLSSSLTAAEEIELGSAGAGGGGGGGAGGKVRKDAKDNLRVLAV